MQGHKRRRPKPAEAADKDFLDNINNDDDLFSFQIFGLGLLVRKGMWPIKGYKIVGKLCLDFSLWWAAINESYLCKHKVCNSIPDVV